VTQAGTGRLVIGRWKKSKRFHRDYDSLTTELKDLTDQKLQDLVLDPRPPGLRFEKLKGYSHPDIYSIHVTGNFKVSLELLDGNCAFLRRVANHDEIDRAP
jgi:plasmid maintenance system killer protein